MLVPYDAGGKRPAADARSLDDRVAEAVGLAEAAAAREAFVTSATTFVMPVVNIDGRPIADGKPGALTQRLRAQVLATAWTQIDAVGV